MKEERIYLLSTEGREASYIKIGCTADLRARMKSYDCANPIYKQHNSFPVPDRACSESIEDALAREAAQFRQGNTEWYKVSTSTLLYFQNITTFAQVLEFVHWTEFIHERITMYDERITNSPKKKLSESNKRMLQKYKEILHTMPR